MELNADTLKNLTPIVRDLVVYSVEMACDYLNDISTDMSDNAEQALSLNLKDVVDQAVTFYQQEISGHDVSQQSEVTETIRDAITETVLTSVIFSVKRSYLERHL